MSSHYSQTDKKIVEELEERQFFIDTLLDAHSSVENFEQRISEHHGISNMTLRKWLNGVDVPHKVFRDKILSWLGNFKKCLSQFPKQ